MSSRLVAGPAALIAIAGIVTGALLESGLPAPVTQWAFIVLSLPLPALGWLLSVRRPDLRYGWLLLAAGLALGLGTLGAGLAVRGGLTPLAAALGSLFAVFYGLTWIFVPLLFPDGRLPSRRWRVAAWISGIAIVLHTVGFALHRMDPYQPRSESLSTWELVLAFVTGGAQFVTWVVAVIVFGGLLVRWRRSGDGERRQYAWMVGGVTATLAGATLISFVQFGGVRTWLVVAMGTLAAVGSIPTVIAVAILRHRLFDVRVGLRGSRLHLMFDLRPTADEVLTDLGPALEDASEPVEQLGRLAAAVRTGLDLRWAAVTLADGTRVVAGEEAGEAVLELQVRGGSARYGGRIECGPRDTGPLTRVDRRLLQALAVPAGLAIQSAGLVTRLINAQEAERRRIERNIHDGVQQQLVALIAGLELARATGAGPDMLAHLREQARQTLADLRELAAGIHPSALSQGGLVEAVEERCARLPVRTTVSSPPSLRSRRFADEVEGAMYFTVSEAVANALKHACATTIDVRLTHDDGRLAATVADDGEGFDPHMVARRGLATLADRLDALGGGLSVDSEPGKGTRVNAWVAVHG
ncbi:hypothetical protein GCM10022224_033460 [Nonomuraea antimicrobica]|uniref:histidine kinase n=1 Tax=Nonomuraea antimicrobica TaxID=561173 RepID=A0ABP7BPK7_9ACTN